MRFSKHRVTILRVMFNRLKDGNTTQQVACNLSADGSQATWTQIELCIRKLTREYRSIMYTVRGSIALMVLGNAMLCSVSLKAMSLRQAQEYGARLVTRINKKEHHHLGLIILFSLRHCSGTI